MGDEGSRKYWAVEDVRRRQAIPPASRAIISQMVKAIQSSPLIYRAIRLLMRSVQFVQPSPVIDNAMLLEYNIPAAALVFQRYWN